VIPYFEKNPSQKRAAEVIQGVGPEFKPQSHSFCLFVFWGVFFGGAKV
jgi:hypothetical protein